MTRRKKAGVALARKLLVIAWAMMRDETEWDPHRLLPADQVEDAVIKVTQQPNVPPGELLHLPKHLREELSESESTPADSGCLTEDCCSADASI